MIEYANFEKAVIITGYGDFYYLIEYLLKQGKLLKVLIPNQFGYSGLLKKLSSPGYNIFDFMNLLRNKLECGGKWKRLS